MPAEEVRIDDGHATLITLQNLPTVKIYEKEVTPPGYNGGGPVDITTMRNTEWRTQSPKKLKTATGISMTVAYASEVLPLIKAQINVNQQVTVQYPDGSTIVIWGWINEFTPSTHVEGEQPTASMTIEASNHDNAEPPAEVAPSYTPPVASS